MITYSSTTLTSYNSITSTEVYYYKSSSATALSGGSWSTTKPTWENGKYIWQKIRTIYEDGTHSESDPVNITGQQGATGTAAYSYKLYTSDSIIGKTQEGTYTITKVTFSATSKQGSGAVSAYSGRFKIESTADGSTWKTEYTSSGNESSKEFTIPANIIAIKCSLYQSGGTTVLLDIVTVPVVKDGVNAIGLRDSVPYYLASDKDTGITRLTQGWTRYKPQLTAEKKYLWVYYVSRYSEGNTEPELIEIKDDLVHFENNGDEAPVESCVADIEPVQDLNGYDYPWIGGAGKNLLPCTMTTKTVNGITFTVKEDGTVTASGTASSTVDVSLEYGRVTNLSGNYYFTGCPSGGKSGTYDVYPWDITTNARPKKWDGSTSAASDYGAFTLQQIQIPEGHELKILLRIFKGQTVNNIVFKPMIVKSTETSTAYEPYENICPITGWTGAKVTRCRKNLLPNRAGTHNDTLGVSYDVNADGTVTVSGTATTATSLFSLVGLGANNRLYLPEGDYVISGDPGGNSNVWFGVLLNIDSGNWHVTTKTSTQRFHVNKGDYVYPRLRVGAGVTVDATFSPTIYRVDDEGAEYEPYSGSTYSITFPSEAGTVYGGTLDVTSGVLTVTHKLYTFDGSENWTAGNHDIRYEFNLDGLPDYIKTWNSGGRGLSNLGIYDNTAYNTSDKNYITSRTNVGASNTGAKTHVLVVPPSVATTVEELKAFLANTPEQWYAPLQTPQTYQLTPQEITMLCKENNLWADTGQTSISYYDNQTLTDPFIDYSATSAFEYSAEALDKIDNLKIGGRNLFKKSNDLTKNVWTVENGVRSGDTVTFTIDSSTTGDIRLYQMPANGYWTWEANTDYAMSIDAMADSNGATIYFNAIGLHKASAHIDITTEWKRYYFIVKGTSASTSSASFFVDNTGTHTVSFRHPKLEKGNKATDWTPAPEDVENSIKAYTESIQSQVDGMAEIHYGTDVPTLSNAPYTSWEDTETKDMHVDDLYYNTSTGYCYRFIKSDSTYSWVRIKDSDITAAATAAGNAQTTANNANTLAGQKRRIFVSQPTPPYEVGDLWVEGSNGDIKKCKTARATGSYTASDWELASKYTDDTLASEANDKIDNLEIGGRNLLLDTAVERISPASSNNSAYAMPVPMMSDYASNILNNTNDYFTYSFDYEVTGNESSGAYIYCQIKGATVPSTSEGYASYVLEKPIGKYCCTFNLTSAQATGDSLYCGIRLRNATNNAILKVWNIKLEKGTKATDWTPAPEDTQADIDTALAQSVEYIIGTQIAATDTWTGKTVDKELKVGKTIAYKLPYAGSGNASLVLTLADNTTTNAIAVYLNTTRVTTHFGAGSVINMTYDGQYWRITSIPNSDTVVNVIPYFSGKTGTLGIWRYSLFMRDGKGTYQNICTASDGTVTTTNSTIETTKKANPNGFEVGSSIWYANGAGYNANTNISGNNVIYSSTTVIDSRYSLNTEREANSLTPYLPIYLIGEIKSDNLFYLDTVWWTQTPTDSSKVYVLIGGCYDSTTSNVRIALYENNGWYKYVNGKLEDYSNRLAELASTTATAYITDTTDNGIMVHPENDTTSGWSIASAIQLFKSGISYIKLWIENNVAKIRIGREDEGHVLIDNDSVDIKNGENVLASFGSDVTIGRQNYHSYLKLDNAATHVYGYDKQEVLTYGTANDPATGLVQITEAGQIGNSEISGRTTYGIALSYKPVQILSVTIDGTLISLNEIFIDESWNWVYVTATQGEKMEVVYTTSANTPFFRLGSYYKNKSYGINSFGVGRNIEVSGVNSGGFGYNTVVKGNNSFACGYNNKVKGNDSFACGENNVIDSTSSRSAIIGLNSKVSHSDTVCMGVDLNSTQSNQCIIGTTNEKQSHTRFDYFIVGVGDLTDNGRKDGFLVAGADNIYDKGCVGIGLNSSAPSDTTDGQLYRLLQYFGWGDVIF